MPHPKFRALRPLLASVAVLLALPSIPACAASFNWKNLTGSWNSAANWVGGAAPTGLDPTDILTFGGDVGTVGLPTIYTATNNLLISPFLLDQFVLQATDPTASGNDNFIAGNGVELIGAGAGFLQNGAGNFTFDMPIQLGNSISVGGTGTGMVTLNQAISGAFDIVKSGPGTLRFGTPFAAPQTGPSPNKWFGSLTINAGTVRFNNNAQSGPTALRANPVILSAGGTLLFSPKVSDPDTSLRLGTLSGSGGLVQARGQTSGGSQDSETITIFAFNNGSYAGLVSNSKIGTQSAAHGLGTLRIRGTATQTLTGTLDIEKDVAVGPGATLTLAGNASLGAQLAGAEILEGGAFRLDNTSVNNANRLRDANSGSTGVDVIGGGSFTLVGNVAGTSEVVGRLQLGSASNPRSGATTIAVVHNAGAGAATVLDFQSYARDQFPVPLNTVDFTATDGSGAVLPLGLAGNAPQIIFKTTIGAVFPVPQFNGLLGDTGSADASTVGWATVNGTDFATHGANGIAPVALDAAPAGSTTGSATGNFQFTGNTTFSNAGGYAANSIKIAPTGPGLSINLSSIGNLNTGAILLAGGNDFSITSSGGGGIANSAGVGPRYFQIQQAALTVGASLGAANAPVVKSGAGTLVLTNAGNNSVTQPLVIDAGVVRAQPGISLPFGELRFRGGVLELTGGGTFHRSIGTGSGNLNWVGIDSLGAAIQEDKGSGGFSAFGADVTVDLNTLGATNLAWEDLGFVDSGYALEFGSRTASARVTFLDNINLTETPPVSNPPAVNYNPREFRVIDNPLSNLDSARLSGLISGTLQNDLLKTGDGLLELTGTNTYLGATLVHEGTLAVNGSIAASFLTDVQPLGQLIGKGVTGAVKVESGGTLAPGDTLGHTSILSTGDLTFAGPGSKLSLEIGGLSAGGDALNGYDQLNITGQVVLNGATLQLSSLGGFMASAGDVFFIVKNDGTDPVIGMFAQGSSVDFAGQLMFISYVGDFASNSVTGGNDIVLFGAPEPASAAFLAAAALGLAARRRRL